MCVINISKNLHKILASDVYTFLQYRCSIHAYIFLYFLIRWIVYEFMMEIFYFITFCLQKMLLSFCEYSRCQSKNMGQGPRTPIHTKCHSKKISLDFLRRTKKYAFSKSIDLEKMSFPIMIKTSFKKLLKDIGEST